MSKKLFEIEPKDYEMLKQYFNLRHSKTCESVVLSSYLWKQYYNTKYFLTDKGLMWVYKPGDDIFTMLPLCKTENLKECFEEIKKYFNEELNQKLVMYLADEEAVSILDLPEEEYIVEEDRRYFDYVYDAEGLRNLSGKKYHKKKNHLNAFKRQFEGRYEFNIIGCHNRQEVLDFLEEWKEARNIEDEYNRVDYESIGIKYVLENCGMLKFVIGGVYIDGKLEAFSIGSYSEEDKTAYIHVEKANPEMRGLYNFINQQFIIYGFPKAELVNREDDMGVEGLRKAKLSYQPVQLVKKYNIIQR